MAAAAFFDLDDTLVRGSALFHFGVHLSRAGVINPIHVLRHLGNQLSYVPQRRDRDGLPADLARRILHMARGRSQTQLCAYARTFVALHLREQLVASALAEVMAFQFRGVPVYLVTASPQDLAEAIATELGLAGAIGTIAEVRDGRYTGLLASPIAHGLQKACRVQAVIADNGWSAQDCWAFSDSVSDLPLLACVGHPVVVNPDRHLKRLAELNDWPILPGSGSVIRPVRTQSTVPLP